MVRPFLVATTCLLTLGIGSAIFWWPVGATRPQSASANTQQQASSGAGGPNKSAIRAAIDPVAVPSTYLAVGGGALPSNTEVSLEQDLALVREVLGEDGVLLFAGGTGSRSVRELSPQALDARDALLVELGTLFAPRTGRDSRYRESRLGAGAATRDAVMERLSAELAVDTRTPLLLYIAAHGEQGEAAADNIVQLWGGESLSVRDLAGLHDASQRPLRTVITSCFSGGFAELAFKGGDPAKGLPSATRCGVFAGTWDRETSGCDPDPERRNQEGYGLHLLHALRGKDRHGNPLELSEVDLDGDQRIGLLEAHSWARTASTSIDVPTTTSERYLRQVQRRLSSVEDTDLLPEDAAVVATLGARLHVVDAGAADRRLAEINAAMKGLERELDDAERNTDGTYYALASQLLSRWPMLDDPYHPDFYDTVTQHEAAIAQVMHLSEQSEAFRRTAAALQDVDFRYGELQVQQSMLLRYLRAGETLRLARALHDRGGVDLQRYLGLLACERRPLRE